MSDTGDDAKTFKNESIPLLDFSIDFICNIFDIDTNLVKNDIYPRIYKCLNISNLAEEDS